MTRSTSHIPQLAIKLRYHPSMTILNLGCGNKKYPNSIAVDISDRYKPDVVHDLNKYPYPFNSSEIDLVIMDNVLEHLDSPLDVMDEIYRLLKLGGTVKIIVPYFRSRWAFIDPTHKTFYTVDSFAYYDPTHPISSQYDYTNTRFNITKKVFNEGISTPNIFKKLLVKLANKFPNRYENVLSTIAPLDDITFYLTKV
jgi:predicted SAM-dependent methyltransferase